MGMAMWNIGRVRHRLWRDGTDCALGRSGLERVVSAIGEFFCCGSMCTCLNGYCLCLWLAVSGHMEDSSCEYKYMVNVIDGTEGSAMESPQLAMPETASWEAQQLEWGIPATEAVDNGALTESIVVAKGACVSIIKYQVLTIGLNQISIV